MDYFEKTIDFEFENFYHGKANLRVWVDDRNTLNVIMSDIDYVTLWKTIDEEIGHYGHHDYSFKCPNNEPLSEEDEIELTDKIIDLAINDDLHLSEVRFSRCSESV